MDYTRFIILCEARTGSTLLHTYLNSHKNILSLGEIVTEKTSKIKKSKNYWKDIIFTKQSHTIAAVGLKIFYEYQKLFNEIFSDLIQMNDVKVIHLIRENHLKLFVSNEIAKKTNKWSTTKKKNKHIKISIDPVNFLKFSNNYYSIKKNIPILFKDHDILQISYEDLTQYKEETLLKVQNFLRVRPKKLFSLLQKQSPENIEESVFNFNDLNKVEELRDFINKN